MPFRHSASPTIALQLPHADAHKLRVACGIRGPGSRDGVAAVVDVHGAGGVGGPSCEVGADFYVHSEITGGEAAAGIVFYRRPSSERLLFLVVSLAKRKYSSRAGMPSL